MIYTYHNNHDILQSYLLFSDHTALLNLYSWSFSCRKATNKLATAFVNSNNFLAKLTGKTKEYYISQLKSMGVANAETVVISTLNNKIEAQSNLEKAAKEKKIALANATWEEIKSTQITLLTRLYNTATRGADKYLKKANSIKLSSNKKTDEKLKKLVKTEASINLHMTNLHYQQPFHILSTLRYIPLTYLAYQQEYHNRLPVLDFPF